MQLDLVDRRRYTGLLDDSLQVRHLEVRDADRARPAVGPQLGQRLPGLRVQIPGGNRPVDQIQVDVVKAEPVETVLKCPQGGVAAVITVPQLGGDEQVLTVKSAAAGRFADTLLVVVHHRRVDRAVTGGDRLPDSLRCVLRRNLEDAEAELGD